MEDDTDANRRVMRRTCALSKALQEHGRLKLMVTNTQKYEQEDGYVGNTRQHVGHISAIQRTIVTQHERTKTIP